MENPLKKVFEFIRTSSHSRIISIVVILLIAAAIPLTVFSLLNTTDLKSRASSVSALWYSPDELIREGRIPPSGQVLEVNLSYNAGAQPVLQIVQVQRKRGYAPLYEIPQENGYTLKVFDATGKVIKSLPFLIPNRVEDPPPLAGEKPVSQVLVLTQVDFVLTIEWMSSAAEVRILTPEGAVIASKNLATIPVLFNLPNFKSIPGNEFRALQRSSLNLKKFVPTARATANPNTLDIVFIGDDYLTASDLDTFHGDVNRFTAHILGYEPFKSRASQIIFHYVDNTVDLGCAPNPIITRLLVCNGAVVAQQVNNSGVPYDEIVVIVNTGAYGGSGGSIAVAYNGDFGDQVFVHEFGHSFGGLIDEYNLYSTDGALDNGVHVNCYAGIPPASGWANLVALADYTLGCNYPNWYRPFPYGIMYSLGTPFFNTVSQVLLNNRLNFFSSLFSDTVSPTSVITAPSAGATVSGVLTVTTSLSDNNGIAWTQLWKDGSFFHNAYEAPFSFSWDTTQETGGFHTLQVKAYDVAGNIGSSPVITVTVTLPPDLIARSLTRWSPPSSLSLITGDLVRFKALVSNTTSGGPAPQSFGRFCIDNTNCLTSPAGRIGTDVTIATLNPEESMFSYSDVWTATPGSHTIRWCVNVGSPPISESNTSNNCISLPSFTVASGNLNVDTDGDGFTDAVERYVGTDPTKRCGIGNWPADFVSGGIPDSTNRVTLSDLTSFTAPIRRLNTSPGDPGYDVRWDLVPGKGPYAKDINIQDLTALTILAPPMFGGGVKAFNGPACTP